MRCLPNTLHLTKQWDSNPWPFDLEPASLIQSAMCSINHASRLYFGFKYDLHRSTKHPKFDLSRVQTHGQYIHVSELLILTTKPLGTSDHGCFIPCLWSTCLNHWAIRDLRSWTLHVMSLKHLSTPLGHQRSLLHQRFQSHPWIINGIGTFDLLTSVYLSN